jgi:hypothetical protein
MGLIDAKVAQSQIRRLASVRGWKDLNDDGKRELLDTLVSASSSDYHARGIIDRWLQTQTWLPAPAELRALADDVPSKPSEARRSHDCPLCRGDGRESYWVLRTVISRWPDSGRVRQQTVERIAPWPGRENMYLIESPRAWREDGTLGRLEERIEAEQTVTLVSGYCRCEYGMHRRSIAARGEAA